VRGRGGRRGSSASAPAATTPDVQPTIEPIVEREVEQPAPIIPPPRAITPSHSSPNDEMDVDPNSSPATQPTETPAPTPIRAPPILPPPSIALASGSTTVPPKKQSKFKPKNVRRTQEELRELQEKERERIDGLNAAAARARKPQFRRTGRGDAMGRGRIVPAAASGPFAEGFDESG
jgi:DNA-directed RNA polymerase III subunit RPC4